METSCIIRSDLLLRTLLDNGFGQGSSKPHANDYEACKGSKYCMHVVYVCARVCACVPVGAEAE